MKVIERSVRWFWEAAARTLLTVMHKAIPIVFDDLAQRFSIDKL